MPGWDTLLRPEEETVIDDEDEKRQQKHRNPLAGGWPAIAVRYSPEINQKSRCQESHGAEEKWRELAHANPDGEEC